MSRFPAAVAAIAVALTATVAVQAGPATADPDQPVAPTPEEAALCYQAWQMAFNPKKYVGYPRYGLGAGAYFSWASVHCTSPDATFPDGTRVAGSGTDVPAYDRLGPALVPAPPEGAGTG